MGDHHKNKTHQLQGKPILLELEQLYQGIPDESVNLTFQDLANVNTSEKKKPTPTIATIEPVSQVTNKATSPNSHSLAKIPSLDFSKGLKASSQHHQDFGHGGAFGDSPWGHSGHGHHDHGDDHAHHHHDPRFSHASGGGEQSTPICRGGGDDHLGYSMSYDDMSVASGRGGGGAGGRRRPGIPHSNICTICSTYIYVFRTRCLVCGRAYCWRCVQIGMGEMVEGRKCIECLGLRFSQRYIEKAGKVGCCSWRYPRTLKQVELMCAEKGPRRSGRSYGHSGIATSRSRSAITSRSTTHAINDHSFVASSSFSAFSPRHNLPF